MVAFAGPISNILLALVFGLLIRLSAVVALPASLLQISGIIVVINILLAIFNLVPIPPLDGSKILFSIIPYRFAYIRTWFEKYSFVVIIIFVFFLWRLIVPVIPVIFRFFTGI